jgi:hypothetical protein
MMSKENGVQMRKIQWLSKPNTDRIYGSMVLHLARPGDAEKLQREVRVEINGETAFVRLYERRAGLAQCFNYKFNQLLTCPSMQSMRCPWPHKSRLHQQQGQVCQIRRTQFDVCRFQDGVWESLISTHMMRAWLGPQGYSDGLPNPSS